MAILEAECPEGEWLRRAEILAKHAETRGRVFDDLSLLSRIIGAVKNATATKDTPTTDTFSGISSNGEGGDHRPARPAWTPSRGSGSDHDHRAGEDPELDQGSAFGAPPPQASPGAASTLFSVFTVLRNSCAGCPANNQALRHTGLAEEALQFAVDQAPFACGPAPLHPTTADSIPQTSRSDSGSRTTGAAVGVADQDGTEASAVGAAGAAAGSDTPGVRFAVRAGLQFACNYGVGSEENKSSLWEAWFPRGLMELTNGLKTDRGLLSLAIALIYNCCLSPAPPPLDEYEGTGAGEGREEHGREDRGRERLEHLVADRAFCCLLMKVVVPQTLSSSSGGIASSASTMGAGSDPAAEWLYLLFCRFVQERLCRDVYDNVGIRAGGRQRLAVAAFAGSMAVGERIAAGDNSEQDGSGGVRSRVRSEPGGEGGEEEGVRQGKAEEREVRPAEAQDEEDFFFPVTPEQLIVLNLAELAAGDEVVTGGERPDPVQRRACDALAVWLVGLLSAMPLNQRLSPRTSTATTAAPAAATATVTGVQEGAPTSPPRRPLSPSETEDGRESLDGTAVDGLAAGQEHVRRRMREEARSAALSALAVLLAGCGGETRRHVAASSSAAFAVDSPTTAAAAAAEPAAAAAATAAPQIPQGERGGRESVPPPRRRSPLSASVKGAPPEKRLVPLCLRLLLGCGGVAAPKPASKMRDRVNSGSSGSKTTAAAAADNSAGGSSEAREAETFVMPTGVPAGRKAELLKVIGNACFRCRDSQDLVREEGGLPLVLNHCAVDEANPLLREHALLAVRNLCEGNLANQEAIAALQPQGCTPGTDEALADLGLEGHVDSEGTFRVDPRLAAPPIRS